MNNTRLDRIERALDAQAQPAADWKPPLLIDDPDPDARCVKVARALEAGFRVVEVVRSEEQT